MSARKAFLIDGTAFCYRAFYAIRHLATADGRPTNAVYGFAVMLQALLEKERPEYLAVAFDVGKPTFRHERFEAYKIQRKPMPEALIGQLPVITALLAAYRIPVFAREGYEGEDVLATIAKRITQDGLEVFLVTGDKDALQLVNSHIKVYNPHHAGEQGSVLDASAVRARYGVDPSSVVDLMALMGDQGDNIPGVPGIGEKTAAELLQRFGSLDSLYERLDEVDSPSRQEQLASARQLAELSRELARIDSEVPLDVSLKELAVQEPDWKALRRLFRELEFKKLLNALDRHSPAAPEAPVAVQLASSPQEGDAVAKILEASTQSVPFIYWPGGAVAGDIGLLSVCVNGDAVWVVPLDHVRASAGLMRWLADGARPKLTHDVKAAYRALGRVGLELRGVAGDTLLAAYLLNPSRTNQRLSDLAEEYLDERLQPPARGEGAMELLPRDTLQALGRWAMMCERLHEALLPQLRSQQLEALYQDLELPLSRVLAEMEAAGVALDLAFLAALRATMEQRLLALTEELYGLAGTSFNLNSPKQLAQVLFERLQLPVVKRTKTGPSTDSEVLRQLASRHALPQRLIEYRELAKLMSTYLDALPRLADAQTGRIHTTLNQTATATGRLSSSEPNLQNIPIKTELGRQIRKAFIPGVAQGVLLAFDYSQIELRVLAHLSEDATLVEAFHAGRDIHRVTAALIYGVPEHEVQPQQRSAMKAVNFGIVFGMSAYGLANELGIPQEDARAFIEAYGARYPKVRAYLEEQIASGLRDGFVQTLLGRRRSIPELKSPDPSVRQFGERMAINTPVQGTAADIIKQAMLEVSMGLRREGLASRMILQVHDELLFEGPKREQEAVIGLVRPVMEQVVPLRVPLTVTVKAGPNWHDLEPVS